MIGPDPQIAPLFEPIRDGNENILWTGKPHYIPYLASGIPFLILGCLWGCFDLFFLVNASRGQVHGAGGSSDIRYFLFPFLALHSFPFWGSILYMLSLFVSYKNTAYALTNRRLILRGGFWGVSYKSLDFDQITEVDVTVGPIERMIDAGTIRANSGRLSNRGAVLYDSCVAIDNPYEVYKLIKETAVNIKTDWNYPNKLRPGDNPGFHTEYKPGP